jgi:hypothetical protein
MIEDDDVPLVEIGLRHVGEEYFVQARRPGDAQHVEYGPMPEAATRPFIEGLKRAVVTLGIAGMDYHEAILKEATESPDRLQRPFNPEEEKKWLQEKK